MIYSIVLAGGKGERFWPLSRSARPKQFLKLTSDKMMLVETIDRVEELIPYDRCRIVTSKSMEAFILNNVERLKKENIIAEPRGRNTCIAIGLAAVHLQHDDPDAVMVVLSADHLIKPPEKLRQILNEGCQIAQSQDCLITIGIIPTRAETGYGYIKQGEVFEHSGKYDVYKVAAFTEKPKAPVAHEYYYSQNYLWNSGMFIWSCKSILKAIEKYQPELFEHLKDYAEQIGSGNEEKAREDLFNRVASISIDFAVLEYADNVLAIKADIVWDDVGGWNALKRYKKVTEDNNVLIGDTLVLDTYETTIYNEEDGIIACLGVSDLVIVRTDNITMVARRSEVDRVKELINELSKDEKNKKYL